MWKGTKIIGQLQFRSIYSAQNTGYINLDYLAPAYRGRAYGKRIHSYIVKCLKNTQCSTAVISISRTNKHAVICIKSMVGHI
ncbi:GNAT family N-acetyltransferase [Pseudohongiella sp. O18]|uniref:GNAT family N-acetyltransferase n=1 Tax=Pseudohongiella sp. O18 TaxID=2904248 RepID=UPI003982F7DE